MPCPSPSPAAPSSLAKLPPFLALLKDCARAKDLCTGSTLHRHILQTGLLHRCPYLGNALITMYARCGMLAKAADVLDELPLQSTVSWNALISGYIQQGRAHEALDSFERMQSMHFAPDQVTFVSVLRACGSIGCIEKGQEIHGEIDNCGLLHCEKNVVLGSALVDMYAKCGALVKALQVLQELPHHDVVCWNALISGYAQQGEGHEALNMYESMLKEGLLPDTVTFISSLNACGSIQAIEKGVQIHGELVCRGLLMKEIVLGNSLIDMYARCGMTDSAALVLRQLPICNVASWNALIAGYVQHGKGFDALNCFESMQTWGFSPDRVTFICILKACGSTGSIHKGAQIHKTIVVCGLLQKDIALGNALVDMYCKCGNLAKAREVLNGLPLRNAVSWCAIITGYIHQGQGYEALDCLEQMQNEGLSPDAVTYVCILKACGITKSICNGEELHKQIKNKGLLDNDPMLGSALVDMYVQCGLVSKARQVLEELPVRNVTSWSVLISGYIQQGQSHQVIDCFEQMQREGFSPDAVIYVCILKACSNKKDVEKGKQVHDMIVSKGLLANDIVLGTALVDMYAKCGALVKAKDVLERLPAPGVVSWNALITGYAQHDRCNEVWSCFKQMQRAGISADPVTLICILKTCGNTGAIDKGEAIHHEVMNKNWLEKDIAIGNALVDMYIKCGVFAKARNVFEALPARDLITWNVLIGGYAQHGAVCEAISCLERMQSEGLCPDAVTFTCTLKACASAGDIDKGREIHEQILGGDLHEKDLVLGNALVDMYAKCGAFSKAQELLEGLPARDVITWNALISGYSQYGHFQEVLECLEKMRGEGIASDVITHICVLKACACMGAIDKGIETHDEIARTLLEEDIVLGNALADMYVKCGVIARALEVLEELPIRDVTSWNTLIAGYAERGQGQEAFDCFQCMLVEGVRGDEITFLSVLSACGHAGLLDEVRMLFGNMSSEHSITPKLGHHACMVIAFGCAGYFDEAVSVIKAMPSSDFPEIWLVLLSVCAKWGNVELGRLAFDQLVQLDRGFGAAYVLIANVFASAGLQEDAKAMDAMEVKYACADKSQQGVQIDAYRSVLTYSFSSEYRRTSSS